MRVTASGGFLPEWPPDGLALSTTPGQYPTVATGDSGAVFTTWSSSDIYAQRVTNSGIISEGWPPDGVEVCTAANLQYEPTMIADGTGGVIVVWSDSRDGPFDIYALRLNRDGGIPTDVFPSDERFGTVIGPAWPNPFRQTISIGVRTAFGGRLHAEIFDIRGRKVRTISLFVSPGQQAILWDGRTDDGVDCAPGTYSLQASIGGEKRSLKLVRTR